MFIHLAESGVAQVPAPVLFAHFAHELAVLGPFDRQEHLEEALAQLTPRERMAVELCGVEEMDRAEAAEKMGVSPSSTDSRDSALSGWARASTATTVWPLHRQAVLRGLEVGWLTGS